MPTLAPPEPIVYVTGMHRSGTSLVMGTLGRLGLDLGDPAQLQPAGADNPVGYFENRYLLEFNDELLAALGGTWDRPPVFASCWDDSAIVEEFRLRAVEVLTSCFATSGSGPCGIKDPRLSILLPFWETIRPARATVVVVRCPTDVVSSLKARNGFSREHGAALWLRYTLAVFRDVPTSLVVDLDRFLADLPSETHRLCHDLGLPAPSGEATEQAQAALDPSLLHHRSGRVGDAPRPSVGGVERLALRMWNHGDLRVETLDPDLVAALIDGHLGPSASAAELTASRADAASLREQLRRSNRKRRDLEARTFEHRS